MFEVNSTDNLIELVSKFEKSFRELDFELHSILTYDSGGEFILHAGYESDLIDPKVIGGLVVAINEFTGKPTKRTIRTIAMKEMTLKFSTQDDVLFVFVTKKAVPSEDKYNTFINRFLDAFHVSFKQERDEEREERDKIATALVKITLLLSEEFQPSLKLGENQTLDLELVFYEADKRISNLLSTFYTEVPKADEEEEEITSETRVPQETDALSNDTPPVSDIEEETRRLEESAGIEEETPVSSDAEAFRSIEVDPFKSIEFMVQKFNQSFPDIMLTTVVVSSPNGAFQTISQGTLPSHILEKLNSTVFELMPVIYSIWDKSVEDRTLELGEYWAFFQKINDSSFMYVITKTHDSIILIEPILERLAFSINSILPSQ
ncbi:MAG: hypothetical protein D6732_14725 [Methanobacteriota archaeon]|nr:MAG: hypothetical protein D6732_14725 [Euryarchaeota archaeon]